MVVGVAPVVAVHPTSMDGVIYASSMVPLEGGGTAPAIWLLGLAIASTLAVNAAHGLREVLRGAGGAVARRSSA